MMLQYSMPVVNFASLCKAESLIAPWVKERAHAISEFLESKGIHDVEYLGSGSFATVVAPKDSKEFVLRYFKGDSTPRRPIPYMLQSIGKWDMDIMDAAGKAEEHSVEILKRLNMNLTSEEMRSFLFEARTHGSMPASLGRGAEIGHYHFTDSAGKSRKVLMASDPSCIDAPPCGGDYAQCTHADHHPSLINQMDENLRIARSDSRIGEFIPSLEQRKLSYSAGEIDIYRSPREQAKRNKELAELHESVMARLAGRKDHPFINQHQPGGRTD